MTTDTPPKVTILIPTYNRATELRRTLEGLAKADRGGIHFEIVVIDNNSDDDTRRVVESFSSELPIEYLFEPTPGKNYGATERSRRAHPRPVESLAASRPPLNRSKREQCRS